MDLRLWASFSVICILLHCCQLCESKPRPGRCNGLIKHQSCPHNSIGFTKRLFDEIMKRTGNDNSDQTDDWQAEDWERELTNGDEAQMELKDEQMFGVRAPSNVGQGAIFNDDSQMTLREKEVEELRTKELQLLLVRAMLDDLENETFDDM